MTLQEFFTDESKWKQLRDGGFNETERGCKCIWLAVNEVFPRTENFFDIGSKQFHERIEKFFNPIAKVIWPNRDPEDIELYELFDWNDAPERTFADIRRVIEEANV